MIYYLGRLNFTTKEAIKKTTQKKYKELRGQVIDELHSDFAYFLALFKMHHDAKVKIGPGVKRIHFRPSLHNFLQTNAIIERIDGTEMSISHTECLNKSTNTTILGCAMRKAIYPHTYEYKMNCKNDVCCFCGSSNNLAVDHIYPFSKLQKEFIKTMPAPTTFDNDSIGTIIFSDADKLFESEWIKYHNSKATYQILCTTCNSKKGAKLIPAPEKPKFNSSYKSPIQDGICFFQIQK